MITLRHCKLTHAMDRHFVSLRWCPTFQCRGSPFLLNQKFKPKIKFYKYKFRAKGKSPREFSISNHGRYLMLLKKSANLFIAQGFAKEPFKWNLSKSILDRQWLEPNYFHKVFQETFLCRVTNFKLEG